MLDREIAFGLIAAVIGTLVVSSFYFAEPDAKAQDAAQAAATSVYSPEDIRYPLHMAEQKARSKSKRKSAPPPPPDPDPSYEDDGDGPTGDSDIEQPPAEEPEID